MTNSNQDDCEGVRHYKDIVMCVPWGHMCPGMSVGKWFTINGKQTGVGLGVGALRLKRDRGSAIAGLGVLGELRCDTESTVIR